MKRERLHSHARTLAARGELHFNELLILVCAPVIITDLMNIYVPCLKFRHMGNRRRILSKSKMGFYMETANVCQTHITNLNRHDAQTHHTASNFWYNNATKTLNRRIYSFHQND